MKTGEPLSEAQRRVLAEWASGKSPGQIADAVTLSEHGVAYHIKEIYRKLGIHTRTEAVLAAVKMGMV